MNLPQFFDNSRILPFMVTLITIVIFLVPNYHRETVEFNLKKISTINYCYNNNFVVRQNNKTICLIEVAPKEISSSYFI